MGIIPEHRAKVKPGDHFNRWTVLGSPFTAVRKRTLVVVECDCGVIGVVQQSALRNGKTKSCGCLMAGATRRRGRGFYGDHGGAGTRLYRIWHGMLRRCRNPNSVGYKDYGGRGISICDEWNDFKAFRDWSLENGYKDRLEIERWDNDGNYEPANCIFATRIQQVRNKRSNHLVAAFGETKCIAEWAEDRRCQVSAGTLTMRLWRGWDGVRAITTPKSK